MMSRLKLLPVTITIAMLLLTLKVGDVWHGADNVLGSGTAVGAEASESANPTSAGSSILDGDEVETAARLATPDVRDISATEVQVLENLVLRRAELDARELEVEMREKLLAAAERRVDVKISELSNIHASVEALIKKFDDGEDAKIESLVKIYENMKAKDAARIFNSLELDVLIALMRRMREAKSAAIIAKMSGEKAKIVTSELALHRDLPEVTDVIN
jgi:flagellar motility protein MotE (MotC chaperone)